MTDNPEKLSKRKDIEILMEVSGLRETAIQAFDQMLETFRLNAPEVYDFFRSEIKFEDIIENVYVHLYSKYFTDDEIKELIKFYNTEVGKKIVRVLPQLFQESYTMTQEYIEEKLQDYED